MTLVLFGPNGQVGRAIIATAGDHQGIDAPGRDRVDLSVPGAAGDYIIARAPRVIINAAAYTAVDKAEEDRALAHQLNAAAPGEMAIAARKTGAMLIHLSTDYVFDGTAHAPIDEDAAPSPLNVYGETKRAGEIAILDSGAEAVIIRTSWVYSAHGQNFLKTMLRLGAARDTLNIVSDQMGAPTPAMAIAAACLHIAGAMAANPSARGLYHFQGAPATHWADFARAIFAAAGLKVSVNDIPSAAYPTPAKRPLYGVLDCTRINRDYAIPQPDWQSSLPPLIAAIRSAEAD